MGETASHVASDMVRRLKNVKDPIERDEILWALDGQKKEEKLPVHLPAFLGKHRRRKAAGPGKHIARRSNNVAGRSSGDIGAPANAPRQHPQLYSHQSCFYFFGISNITRAIEAFRAGAEKEEVSCKPYRDRLYSLALAGFFSGKMKKAMEKRKASKCAAVLSG